MDEPENSLRNGIFSIFFPNLSNLLTNVSGVDKVHIGATSYDIVDSMLALQLKEANKIFCKTVNSTA